MARRNGRRISKVSKGASPKVAPGTAPKETIEEPTPEQARRVEYERRPVRSEMGQPIGFSYRRKPLFETMAAKPGTIAANELAALRYYRSAYDRSVRSPTKSCLDVTGGGGGRGVPAELANATASMIDAKRRVALCEAAVGKTLTTMRGVVLDDRSFSDLACERFGHRTQSWIVVDVPVVRNGQPVIVDGKPLIKAEHREKIAPRSGRHREIIRTEFFQGLALLSAQLSSAVNMRGVDELWVELIDDGARIERGLCAPSRRYRLWGSKDQVSEVLFHLNKAHGADKTFTTAAAARQALDAANKDACGRLLALEDDELAA